MLNWKNKQDGVDDVLAEDINNIANELIASQISIDQLKFSKQEKLTAGDNITIDENNVISATGGGGSGGGSITVDQTYNAESESAQSGKAVAEAINEIDDKKVNKILRSDVADISEYDSTPNRIPYLYSVLENNKQSLIKGSTGIIVSELAEQYEETDPELSEKILNGIIPEEVKQYLDPHTFVMRDGNCAVPCGLHIYDKDEIGNIVNSVLYYGAAVPQGYMRAYVDEKMDTKKITSIYANYKYEFDYNALYLLKSNSGNKDIEILDGNGKNVIGYKSSYCLLILPKKTYQRTEYTATIDKKDRELDKVNCIFAGITDKSALITTDKIQMLQFEVDPNKKISVTPSSSGISIFKVAF